MNSTVWITFHHILHTEGINLVHNRYPTDWKLTSDF